MMSEQRPPDETVKEERRSAGLKDCRGRAGTYFIAEEQIGIYSHRQSRTLEDLAQVM